MAVTFEASETETASLQADFLTKKEVAAYLRVDPRTLDRRHSAGRGPVRIRIEGTGRVLYRRVDVVSWMASQPKGKQSDD